MLIQSDKKKIATFFRAYFHILQIPSSFWMIISGFTNNGIDLLRGTNVLWLILLEAMTKTVFLYFRIMWHTTKRLHFNYTPTAAIIVTLLRRNCCEHRFCHSWFPCINYKTLQLVNWSVSLHPTSPFYTLIPFSIVCTIRILYHAFLLKNVMFYAHYRLLFSPHLLTPRCLVAY